MLRKIKSYLLERKLLKQYYEEKAQEVMKEYLQKDKSCIGIHDKEGKIKEIRKLKVIEHKASD